MSDTAPRPSDSSLLPRLLSSALLIGVLVSTIYFSKTYWYLCLAVCEVIVFFGLREALDLLQAKGVKIFRGYTLAGGMAILAAIFFNTFPQNRDGDLVLAVLFAWCIGLFFIVARQKAIQGAMHTLFSSVAAILYVVFLFGSLLKINYLQGVDGRCYLLFTFITVYAADISAYAVGSVWGKRPLAPAISPRKTQEGAAAAIAGAALAAIIAKFLFLQELPVMHALFLGLLIGIVSQVGDLWESLLKRDAQVKDSGHSIPGMGGVLDLMDGLLFCGPLVYLYLKIFLGY